MRLSRWGPLSAALLLAVTGLISQPKVTEPEVSAVSAPTLAPEAPRPMSDVVLPTHAFVTSGAVSAVGLNLRSQAAELAVDHFMIAASWRPDPAILSVGEAMPRRQSRPPKGPNRVARHNLAPGYIRV